MKALSIILALLAVGFFLADGWFGPLYSMYDHCTCHRSRSWWEFEECESLRGKKFFLRIDYQGDLGHQHDFCDATYGHQIPVFMFVAIGLGILSAASWRSGCKRAMLYT